MLSTASLAAMTRAAALLALAASLGSAGSDTQRVVVAQRVAALTGANEPPVSHRAAPPREPSPRQRLVAQATTQPPALRRRRQQAVDDGLGWFSCPRDGNLPGNNIPLEGGVTFITRNDPESCALTCRARSSCVSFDYSASEARCYLGSGVADVNTPLSAGSGYSYYEMVASHDDGCQYGCTDPVAVNFDLNAAAQSPTDTCVMPVLGCRDPTALNFDPDANQNSRRCVYTWLQQDFLCPGSSSGAGHDVASTMHLSGVRSADDCAEECLLRADCGSFDYAEPDGAYDGECFLMRAVASGGDSTSGYVNYARLANVFVSDAEPIGCVMGCTDLTAFNYNPGADMDDGLCNIKYDCNDRAAVNWDSLARTAEACQYTWLFAYACPVEGRLPLVLNDASDGLLLVNNSEVTTVTNASQCAYRCLENDQCASFDLDNSTQAAADESRACYLRSVRAGTWTGQLSLETGNGFIHYELQGATVRPCVYGCTNPEYANYEPAAEVQFGTCEPRVPGCTAGPPAAALNFDPVANWPMDEQEWELDTGAVGACVFTNLSKWFDCPLHRTQLPNSAYLGDLPGNVCRDNVQDGNLCNHYALTGADMSVQLEECAQHCLDESRCLRFDFNIRPGQTSRCYLGGDGDETEPEPGNRTSHYYFSKISGTAAGDTGCIYGCMERNATNYMSVAEADCDPLGPHDCRACLFPSGCEHEGTCDALVLFHCPIVGHLPGYDIDLGGGLDHVPGVVSAEECASYCLADIRCVSFDFSLNQSKCHLGTAGEGLGRHVQPGTDISNANTNVNIPGAACLSCPGQFVDYLYYELAEQDRVAVPQSEYRRGCVYGCAVDDSINYNVQAGDSGMDDGSCVAKVLGCRDPTATNYNATASVDTETTQAACGRIERFIHGTDHSGGQIVRYGVGGTDDAGVDCVLNAAGDECVVATGACRFLQRPFRNSVNLTVDIHVDMGDGSCWRAKIVGCTDHNAPNLDPLATNEIDPPYVNESLCDPPIVQGCTNASAINHQRAANTDDGSCIFDVLSLFGCPQDGQLLDATFDSQTNLTLPECADRCRNSTDCRSFAFHGPIEWLAPDNTSALMPIVTAWLQTSPVERLNEYRSCSLYATTVSAGTFNASAVGAHHYDKSESGHPDCIYGCNRTLPTMSNFDTEASVDDGSCIPVAFGCTDEDSAAYIDNATVSNGECGGCTLAAALNYDADTVEYNKSCADGAIQLFTCPQPGGMPSLYALPQGSADYYDGIGSATRCAELCIADYRCVSFDYSPTLRRCRPGTFVATWAGDTAELPAIWPPEDGIWRGVTTVQSHAVDLVDEANYSYYERMDYTADCPEGASGGSWWVNIWVDAVAGNDLNSGATRDDAFMTIWAALSSAYARDLPRIHADCDATRDLYATTIMLHLVEGAGVRSSRLKRWDPFGCKHGCMTPDALNFDPDATVHDTACIANITGCMNTGKVNFDPQATWEAEDSCEPYIFGCNDTTAVNYDDNALHLDSSCVESALDLFRCPQTVQVAPPDPFALAIPMDLMVLGSEGRENRSVLLACAVECLRLSRTFPESCTRAASCTGNITGADCAANSLFVASGLETDCQVAEGCVFMAADAADQVCTAADLSSDNVTADELSCETTGTASQCTYDGTCAMFVANGTHCFVPSDGGSLIPLETAAAADSNVTNYAYQVFHMSEWRAIHGLRHLPPVRDRCQSFGCTHPYAYNYDPMVAADDGSCRYPPTPPDLGCTNETALNYNETATHDDGSCIESRPGCMKPMSPAFDAAANNQPDDYNDTVICTPLELGCAALSQSTAFALETLRVANLTMDPLPIAAPNCTLYTDPIYEDHLSMFSCPQPGGFGFVATPVWGPDGIQMTPARCASLCIELDELEGEPPEERCSSFGFAYELLVPTQSCTGTGTLPTDAAANATTPTCDLDPATDSRADCPAGCTLVDLPTRGHCLLHTFEGTDWTAHPAEMQSEAARARGGTAQLQAFGDTAYEYHHYDRVSHEGAGCRYSCIPDGDMYGSVGHTAAGVVPAATCPAAVPGCMDRSATNYDPQATTVSQACTYSALGLEFRCGVPGALQQRNLPAPGGFIDYWAGVQTPAICALICQNTTGCLSFDHSAETGRCYLGDGVAGVHAILWSPPSGNYRYYERVASGNMEQINEARAAFLGLSYRVEDAGIGCRYGCTDWRAENYDPQAQDSGAAEGDSGTCTYRAEPALAAFEDPVADRVLISGGVPGDGRFVAQFGGVVCEEICAARCLAAGPECVAINYATRMQQCYLLSRTAEPGAAGGLRVVRGYSYRERSVLRLPRPWAPLPGLMTFDDLMPSENRTAAVGSLLRFDLAPGYLTTREVGLNLTDIWRTVDAADRCALTGGAAAVVAARGDWAVTANSGGASAVVALDTVGSFRFLPRSKALCAAGLVLTVEVVGGAPGRWNGTHSVPRLWSAADGSSMADRYRCG